MSVSGDTAVVTLHRAGADPLGVRSALAGLGVEIDRGGARADLILQRIRHLL
jgi:hypothetical protein